MRDLGVYIDADTATVKAYFAVLRQIRGVRRSVLRYVLLTLIHDLIRG